MNPTHDQTHTPSSAQLWLGGLAIIAATMLAYLPVIWAGFIWDDDWYVTNNVHLLDLKGLLNIWFVPGATPQYYPAVFTSFWIEHKLWGFSPAGYHIVNVLLHGATALLVWRLCAVLRIRGAWLIAAVFALHPVHVESVAWITERKNVLSGLLYLAAALCYLRFDSMRFEQPSPDARQAWRWYGASAVLFVLALLSKSVTCSLPAAIILMLLWQRKALSVRRLVPLAPLFAIGLLLALNTVHLERTHVGAEGGEFAFSLADRFLIASKVLLFYPWKVVWPWPLMFNYPRWIIDDSAVASYWSVGVVALVALAAIVMYLRGRRGVPLALAFYAGAIFPALGFFNFYPMQFSFVADHHQYLASLGIIALVIGGLVYVVRVRVATVVIALAVLPALGALTFAQARTYHSAESVYRDTLNKNREAFMPHINLGLIIVDRDPVEAEFHFREALRIKPGYYKASFNLVTALRRQGRLDDAVRQLQSTIVEVQSLARAMNRKEPVFLAQEHVRLAQLSLELGQAEQAEGAFLKALNLTPKDLEIRKELARLYIHQQRWSDAATHVDAALAVNQHDWWALRALAVVLYEQNQFTASKERFELALIAATSLPEYAQTVSEYIRRLATSADSEFRDLDRAIALAEEFCTLTKRDEYAALDILASVYAEAGRFDDAIRTAGEAQNAALRQGAEQEAQAISSRIERYRAGRRAWD